MKHIEQKNLDTAFVQPGTPMFSDVIDKLQSDSTLKPERRRDLISALRRTAKALGRQPDAIPADPKWLQPRIARIVPAGIGLSPKSWSNVRSDLQAALAHVGITKRRVNRKHHLSPDWLVLWDRVLASGDPTLRASLSKFVYFLNGQKICPDDVRSAHGLAFRDAVALNEISRAPGTTLVNTVSAWNLAIGRISGWPRERLSAPSRQKVVKIPLDQLPESFRRDLDAYITSLESPDPFAIDGRLTPLQPMSIKVYKARVLRFAGALVRAGVSIDELCTLADLVDPVRMKQGLLWMLAQNDGEKSASISDTAQLLSGIARRYVRLAEKEQKRVETLAQQIAMKPQSGLTSKNRERLRPLQDPQNRRKLLTLPEQLFAQADQMTQSRSAACLREQAVAIAILLYCPIRVKNLASIHLERTLQRPGNGRSFLVFSANEVKNRHPIELELPQRVVDLITKHCATRSSWLCTPDNQWLFPARESEGGMDPNTLSRSVFRTIRKTTGLEVNVHLFRHLAAMLYLQARPGEYEAVRRLLGHSQLSRTLDAYAGFEAGTATRLFGDIIDAERQR